jgi:hypothetical protein
LKQPKVIFVIRDALLAQAAAAKKQLTTASVADSCEGFTGKVRPAWLPGFFRSLPAGRQKGAVL